MKGNCHEIEHVQLQFGVTKQGVMIKFISKRLPLNFIIISFLCFKNQVSAQESCSSDVVEIINNISETNDGNRYTLNIFVKEGWYLVLDDPAGTGFQPLAIDIKHSKCRKTGLFGIVCKPNL